MGSCVPFIMASIFVLMFHSSTELRTNPMHHRTSAKNKSISKIHRKINQIILEPISLDSKSPVILDLILRFMKPSNMEIIKLLNKSYYFIDGACNYDLDFLNVYDDDLLEEGWRWPFFVYWLHQKYNYYCSRNIFHDKWSQKIVILFLNDYQRDSMQYRLQCFPIWEYYIKHSIKSMMQQNKNYDFVAIIMHQMQLYHGISIMDLDSIQNYHKKKLFEKWLHLDYSFLSRNCSRKPTHHKIFNSFILQYLTCEKVTSNVDKYLDTSIIYLTRALYRHNSPYCNAQSSMIIMKACLNHNRTASLFYIWKLQRVQALFKAYELG